MFNHLVYSVTFANPARTFEQDIVFNEGLTAITGPNGKGKSLILEMIKYALREACYCFGLHREWC
jgi:predicted ATP-binding protein involved in virulence